MYGPVCFRARLRPRLLDRRGAWTNRRPLPAPLAGERLSPRLHLRPRRGHGRRNVRRGRRVRRFSGSRAAGRSTLLVSTHRRRVPALSRADGDALARAARAFGWLARWVEGVASWRLWLDARADAEQS